MVQILEKLEKIFMDVTDVTDPSGMDKVLTILERSRIENDDYIELLVKKLNDEEVTWEQPPYQATFGLTRKPPPKLSEQCTSGRFTKKEGEIVQQNWEQFIQEYDVPNTPICLARWKNRKMITNARCPQERARNFVMAYLARGLQRNLYQVYKYFISQYGYPVKLRTYTETEEKIMEICFIHKPAEACIMLPEVLGREARGIYKRHSQYFHGKPDPRPKLKWKLTLAAEFIYHLMKYSGCSFKKLKNNQFDKKVWLQMQETMGPLSQHLQKFWFSKLHVQLFAKCSIKLNSLKMLICKKLKKSPYEIWSDIRWNDVAKEFPDGITAMFLYREANCMLCSYPDYLTCPLPELLARAQRDRSTRRCNRRFKSLQFHKDGSLTYITHDISLKELMAEMKMNKIE